MSNDGKYKIIKIGDIDAILLEENNYVNITKICYIYGKRFDNWMRNNNSKKFIKYIEKYIGKKAIIKNIIGNNDTRGTYVHPLVITNIAFWISPKFQAKVSIWINEWKKINAENTISYNKEISNLKVSNNEDIEKQIRDKLHNKLGGKAKMLSD